MKLQQARTFWGNAKIKLPLVDLLAVQKRSWQNFLKEGIWESIQEINPVEDFTGKNWELQFLSFSFDQVSRTPAEAKKKGLNYDAPLKAKVKLINKQNGKEVIQEVFLGDVPQMTSEGTFIINGVERCVVNQIIRSPGVFFTGEVDPATGKTFYNAEIRPVHGTWLEFLVSRNGVVSARVDRRRKFAATTILRAMGLSTDEEIIEAFSWNSSKENNPQNEEFSFLQKTLDHDSAKTTEEAIIEIYRKMRPGEPAILANAQSFFNDLFFNPRRYNLGKVGRYKVNKRLKIEVPNIEKNYVLTTKDVVETIKYLISLQTGKGETDDIDHLANRRIRCVGEQVAQSAFRIGLLRLERMIKERMSLISADEKVLPTTLINARPLISAINEFFRSNQLSTILDQTNPLSELDNLRRLSVTGQGGITRERASFSIRDIDSSQYSRICPVRSPEGPNIGLVTYLALFANVNDYGFLEAPYRKIIKEKSGAAIKMKVTDEIVYLQADDEKEYYITHAKVNVDEKGYITDKWVPVRYQGGFTETSVEKVSFMDVAPSQVVGMSASLIPFLANDEANRALMGTHMQCQAVPLLAPEAPMVGTGMEAVVTQTTKKIVRARHSGKIVYADARKVVLRVSGKVKKDLPEEENIEIEGNLETYYLDKFSRTNPYGTCYSQRLVVETGEEVKEGDLLIDGPASEKGELALGRNLVIAYCSFEGLGFEDAIIISQRLVKEDVFTSISIEEYETQVVDTKLGPEELTRDIPNVSEQDLANLGEDGIVVIGAEVQQNDILVGKIAPKGETELSAEERLLRAIFGEKAREVRDTSLRMPHGERGTVIDIQILDREKGDELEPGVNMTIKVKVAQIRKITEGDKLAGRHGNKGVISKIVPVYDMPHLEDGTPVDIIISPLSALARMNLGQLLEAHLGWLCKKENLKVSVPVFEKTNEDLIWQEFEKMGFPSDGKVTLYDGRTGEPFDQKVTVGVAYIMKLIHMVEDKTHARSTGPYSLITQQPLGGKAQMGGQRLGEMEVWALEAHRAAHVLQEMLTIKSDDVVGRAKAFEAIVKGADIPQASVPESFNVLVNELKALGLNIVPRGVVEKKVPEEGEINEVDQKEAEELAQASGAAVINDSGAVLTEDSGKNLSEES
ncbi:MAG: DNA-directed RNA polymerase subunit beta [Microgenomates group bacterium ADurb.Bin219]|nr:MAG: DNA-directed RNA polymerase subunit beta [Microgenomates group bacterium ADurb.Bin219]